MKVRGRGGRRRDRENDFAIGDAKNCPLKCIIFQTNEENFTFVTFKTDVSTKWKLLYSRISF